MRAPAESRPSRIATGDGMTDLTNVLLDALGKRIEEPEAERLAEALGKKAFKSGTPNNQPGIGSAKLGLEVGTHIDVKNRTFWPLRREQLLAHAGRAADGR
jgi:hypothetical protein